jgi:hypothetical protein
MVELLLLVLWMVEPLPEAAESYLQSEQVMLLVERLDGLDQRAQISWDLVDYLTYHGLSGEKFLVVAAFF